MDRLEGHWLAELAGVDARGAAGAEQGVQAGSTAAWLRHRFHMSPSTAASLVRTARALYRGPLTATGQALTEGTISPAHAQVLAHSTQDLPDHVTAEAEPVLLEAARRLDPPRLRRVIAHLRRVADPDGAQDQAERRHQRRGVWLSPTWEGMVALQGLLDPEAGQTLLAALEPLTRPSDTQDARTGGQRRADALAEPARRNLEGGQLPQTGGVRPQLLVTVDLDSLLGPDGLGGETGGPWPLDPETCRRLACDGAVTRVVVTRHRTHPTDHPNRHPGGEERSAAPAPQEKPRQAVHDPSHQEAAAARDPSDEVVVVARDPTDGEGLEGRLWTAVAMLSPSLGVRPPSRWRSAGPAASSPPPNAPP